MRLYNTLFDGLAGCAALAILPADRRPRIHWLALGRKRDTVIPLQQTNNEKRRLVVRKLLSDALPCARQKPARARGVCRGKTRTIRGPALKGMNTNGLGVTCFRTLSSKNRLGSNMSASSPQYGLCRCASMEETVTLRSGDDQHPRRHLR
jgi:hypothetical protein